MARKRPESLFMPQHEDSGHWFDCWYNAVPYRRARDIANQFVRVGYRVRLLYVTEHDNG